MKFSLEIEMGNEAMSSDHDVSEALFELADCILGRPEGKIKDVNGNTVGSWKFEEAG